MLDIVPDKLCLSNDSPNSFNSSSALALLSIFFSGVLIDSPDNEIKLLTICSFLSDNIIIIIYYD